MNQRAKRPLAIVPTAVAICLLVPLQARAQYDLLIANSRHLEAEIGAQASLIEGVSFGTETTARQIADGLRVRLSGDCSTLELKGQVRPPDAKWYWAVAQRPVMVTATGGWVLVEGATLVGDLVDQAGDGLDPSVRQSLLQQRRARLMLRFSAPTDAVKVGAALERWSKACAASPAVSATQAVVMIGADTDIVLQINGIAAGRVAARMTRAFQVSPGLVNIVARTDSEGVQDTQTVRVSAGQQAIVPILLSEKIDLARRSRLDRERTQIQAAVRRRFDDAIQSEAQGRTQRLRNAFRNLESQGPATEEDRRRYALALEEQVIVKMEIASIDNRAVGRALAGTIGLVAVGAEKYYKTFDPFVQDDSEDVELRVGSQLFTLSVDMEFDRADFSDASCTGTVVISPRTSRIGVVVTLLRGGSVQCALRPF